MTKNNTAEIQRNYVLPGFAGLLGRKAITERKVVRIKKTETSEEQKVRELKEMQEKLDRMPPIIVDGKLRAAGDYKDITEDE